MPHLAIALLGPVAVRLDGAPIPGLDYTKVRALLIYLAVEAGREHQREALAELLWPDQPPQQSRASLRQALNMLRKAIGDQAAEPPFLAGGRETLRLNPAGDHSVDVAAFRALIAACAAHPHADPAACAECAARLAQAAQLYRGPFAADALPRDTPEFEEWALGWRGRLEAHALEALSRLAEHHLGRAEPAQALIYARRQIELDPLREPAYRQAMRAEAAQGARSAALAFYEQCRRLLDAELGVEPEPATSALYAELLAAPAAPAGPREPAELPPASYALPHPATSFVGREQELAELAGLLADPVCRLVTLRGPGGAGKTRLALQLAAILAPHFRHGVCWVPLAPLPAAEFLADALGAALGCDLDGAADPWARLAAFLRPRQLLAVLDNAEHMLDAAPRLADLLAQAPHLRLLVTSRAPLDLQAEWLFELAGLPIPPAADAAGDYPALSLLLERLRQARRGAPLPASERAAAARVARAVEGLPLALELAAAAGRERSLAEVAAGIERGLDLLAVTYRDLPERHRSMRAAIDHSWRTLAPGEQRGAAWLSVFRGGFAAEDAAQVAGLGANELDALSTRSLLRRNGPRYEMHEQIRQFAAEELERAGEAEAAREAHLAVAVALAETAEPHLLGEEQARWLARLAVEHANLRTALRWGIDSGHVPLAGRAAAALWRFWWIGGHVGEGRRWLDELLSRGPELPQATLAKAARGAGNLANEQGDYRRARACYAMSLEVERALGNQRGVAAALGNMALVASNQGDYAEARALLEETVAIQRALGNQRGLSLALDGLADVAEAQGDLAQARALYGEAMAMHLERGDEHSAAVARLNLAEIDRAAGDHAAAAAGAQSALAAFRQFGNGRGVAAALHLLAVLARVAGEHAAARARYVEAVPLLRAGGHSTDLALALGSLGALAAAEGRWALAARLCAAAEAWRAALGGPVRAADRQELAAAREAAQHNLAPEAFADALAAGRALDPEAALEEALRVP